MPAAARRKPSSVSNKNSPENNVTPLRPDAAGTLAPTRRLDGLLHVLTCGSVDDGKSTLIGRLLWDASDLYEDQRASITHSAAKNGGKPDYSLLVDGLVAEREQGITIDIAWRYFDSNKRRIVIIDSPGHEQYTRNMASGASHADVAIMLVDARSGVKRQTRRHAAILDLIGVKQVVLAVNKMDLVSWSEADFRRIAADFAALTAGFGFINATAIPVSAVGGDNVASVSANTPWYDGPSLLAYLESLPPRASVVTGPFRMAVQTVLRDGQDFRGLAGTVNSGRVCVGDRIVDVLSGQSSRVLRIATMDRDLEIATTGQAVAIQLEHDLDIARGAIVSGPSTPPVAASQIEARLVWLSEAPSDSKASYLLRTATDLVSVSGIEIAGLLDLETMQRQPASACGLNDIADVRLNVSRPVALDRFGDIAATGNVMLVDALTGTSIAGGVVLELRAAADLAIAHQTYSSEAVPAEMAASGAGADAPGSNGAGAFVVTRAMLARGLNADLTNTKADRAEAARRAREVLAILATAGVAAVLEDV